jgi:hypothetical protein
MSELSTASNSTNSDLKTYAEIGRALWADPSRSSEMAVETLSAIALMDLTQERALEKASQALLDRAVRQGMASNTLSALDTGQFGAFFKLQPEERFVLVALHLGRWTYERTARVLQIQPEVVEALAWRARSQIGISQGLTPIGAKIASANCPEYDLDRPWTQRFLDEEMGKGRETVFLGNHLMACESCSRSLARCRDIYFRVEAMLPRVPDDDGILRVLAKVSTDGKKLRSNEGYTFSDSIAAFFSQRSIQILFALVFVLAIYRLKHS